MNAKTFFYPTTIKEVYLDILGHMNNTMYLTLFEEARWELITQNGYGLKEIRETGIGPVILGVEIKFLKELLLREEIIIESQCLSYERKIGKLKQKMIRNGEDCCTAEFTLGLFDLNTRRLVLPTPKWLHAIGMMPV